MAVAVLYGIKSIAIGKLNEFLYGIRDCRRRKTAVEGEMEDEPLLYFFWQACHHGVPFNERIPNEESERYVDLLAEVANACAEEHTLNLKGVGAFWNLLGTMTEIRVCFVWIEAPAFRSPTLLRAASLRRLPCLHLMLLHTRDPQRRPTRLRVSSHAAQVPAFVLLKALQSEYGPREPSEAFPKGHAGHPDLLERLRKSITAAAAAYLKDSKDKRKAPVAAPSYKPTVLGPESFKDKEHLPVESFLKLCLEGVAAQRVRDGQTQQAIYDQCVCLRREPVPLPRACPFSTASTYAYLFACARPPGHSQGPSPSGLLACSSLRRWEKKAIKDGNSKGFEVFAEMMGASSPEMAEADLVGLYQKATSGEDPDQVELILIVENLRKLGVKLVRPAGATAIGDGVGTKEDVFAAAAISSALRMFSPKKSVISEGIMANMSKWQRVGLQAGKARSILKGILDGEEDQGGEDAEEDLRSQTEAIVRQM